MKIIEYRSPSKELRGYIIMNDFNCYLQDNYGGKGGIKWTCAKSHAICFDSLKEAEEYLEKYKNEN